MASKNYTHIGRSVPNELKEFKMESKHLGALFFVSLILLFIIHCIYKLTYGILLTHFTYLVLIEY